MIFLAVLFLWIAPAADSSQFSSVWWIETLLLGTAAFEWI